MAFFRRAVVLAFLVSAVACGSDYTAPPAAPSPTPAPAPAPTPAPSPQSASVSIPSGASVLGDRAYVPAELTVAAGTTVTWTNTDSTSHTTTSDAPGFDSGIVGSSRTFSFVFQNAGTFSYHCAIHPSMVGTVVVR